MPRKGREVFEKAYAAQKTGLDKLWYSIEYSNYVTLLNLGDRYDVQDREELGFYEEDNATDEDYDLSKTMLSDAADELVMDGTPQAYTRLFRMCGAVQAKIRARNAQDYYRVYDTLAGEEDRDRKADYLYATGHMQFRNNGFAESWSFIVTDKGGAYGDLIGQAIGGDKTMTYRRLGEKLGWDEAFLNRFAEQKGKGFSPDVSIYDDFRKKRYPDGREPDAAAAEALFDGIAKDLASSSADLLLVAGREEAAAKMPPEEKRLFDKGDELSTMETDQDGLADWLTTGYEIAMDLEDANIAYQARKAGDALSIPEPVNFGAPGSPTEIDPPGGGPAVDYLSPIILDRAEGTDYAKWLVTGKKPASLEEAERKNAADRARAELRQTTRNAQDEYLRQLRGEREASPSVVKVFAEAYLRDRFLTTADRNQFPERFDESGGSYDDAHAALSDEIGSYVDKCMAGLDPEGTKKAWDGAELADFLEHGGHGEYFDAIARRARGSMLRKERADLEANPYSARAAEALRKAPARFGSGSRIYDEITSGLDRMGRERESFREQLAAMARGDEGAGPDPEALKRYNEEYRVTLEKMDKYLADKTALKERKGDLGANGERRFAEMRRAREALLRERRLLNDLSGGIPGEEELQPDAAELKSRAEKKLGRLAEDAVEQAEKADALFEADKLAREAERQQAEYRLQLDPDSIFYKGKLEGSASRSLYIRAASNLARGKGNGPEGLKLVKAYGRQMEKMLKAKDGISVGARGFYQDMFSNKTYAKKLAELLAQGIKEGKNGPEDIMRFSDEALKYAYPRSSPDERKKLDILSASIGSQVNSRSPGIAQEIEKNRPSGEKEKDGPGAESGGSSLSP